MAELFEHGRRQLQAGDHAGPHPEADVLNAYMEGVLPERERAPVVAHLSQCSECREVVALAAPPMADATRSAASLRDPAMRLALWRWVVVATTAVVVLAAVLFRSDRQEEFRAPLSTVAEAPAENAPATPSAPAPASSKPAPARDESASSEVAKQAAAPRAASKPGASTMAQEQSQEKKDGQPKDAQLATAATNTGVVGNSPAAAADSFSAGARSDRKANLPAPAAVTLQAANETAQAAAPPAAAPKVERTMPSFTGALRAEPAEAVKMKSARAAAAPVSAAVAEYSAPPRWSVSENGTVLRSTDAGRSWQTLRVSEGIRFRAVAAVGQQIWAGGSEGALFHSSDGGHSWTRLPLRVGGDIMRVTFSDALHGSVETSAGETWTTSDGGRNWQRR